MAYRVLDHPDCMSLQSCSAPSKDWSFHASSQCKLDPSKDEDVVLAHIIATASSENRDSRQMQPFKQHLLVRIMNSDATNSVSLTSFDLQTLPKLADLQTWLNLSVHNVSPRVLSLSRMDLSEVKWPAAVPAMSRVRWLDLSRCKLSDVPAVLRSCASLSRLELQHNSFKELPDWLSPSGALPALKYLDVSFTRISTLPVIFSKLSTLRAFGCDQLAEHYKTHADSADQRKLMGYLDQCAKGEMKLLDRVTTTLLGSANVGKSIILECMTMPPPEWYERNAMKEHRARTRYPIIEPHEHKSDGTAAPLHVLFTDPPGTLSLCADTVGHAM